MRAELDNLGPLDSQAAEHHLTARNFVVTSIPSVFSHNFSGFQGLGYKHSEITAKHTENIWFQPHQSNLGKFHIVF